MWTGRATALASKGCLRIIRQRGHLCVSSQSMIVSARASARPEAHLRVELQEATPPLSQRTISCMDWWIVREQKYNKQLVHTSRQKCGQIDDVGVGVLTALESTQKRITLDTHCFQPAYALCHMQVSFWYQHIHFNMHDVPSLRGVWDVIQHCFRKQLPQYKPLTKW